MDKLNAPPGVRRSSRCVNSHRTATYVHRGNQTQMARETFLYVGPPDTLRTLVEPDEENLPDEQNLPRTRRIFPGRGGSSSGEENLPRTRRIFPGRGESSPDERIFRRIFPGRGESSRTRRIFPWRGESSPDEENPISSYPILSYNINLILILILI